MVSGGVGGQVVVISVGIQVCGYISMKAMEVCLCSRTCSTECRCRCSGVMGVGIQAMSGVGKCKYVSGRGCRHMCRQWV